MAGFQLMRFKQAQGCSAATCTNELRTAKFFLMSTTRDFEAVPPRAGPVGTMARNVRSEQLKERSWRWKGTTLPSVRPLVLLISSIVARLPEQMTSETGEPNRCLKNPVSYSLSSRQIVMLAEEPRAPSGRTAPVPLSLDPSEEFILARTSGDTWLTLAIHNSFRCLIFSFLRAIRLSSYSFFHSSLSRCLTHLYSLLWLPIKGCTGRTGKGISPSR